MFFSKVVCISMVAFFGFGRLESQAHQIVISTADQKMALVENGQILAVWPVSTSKYGLGDKWGSYATPLGNLRVREKIGAGAPLGTVFKSRQRTGEILRPNAPGRDPVVTRILWLEGTETQNRNALARCIYIHGTSEEYKIGKPASYGCIRMRSQDIIRLFDEIELGTQVTIIPKKLPRQLLHSAKPASKAIVASLLGSV